MDWEKLLAQAAEKAKAAQAIYAGEKPDAAALKTADALMVEAEALRTRAESLKAATAITDADNAAKAARAKLEAEPPVNEGKAGFVVEGDTLTGGEPNEGKAAYPFGEFLQDVARYYKGNGFTPRLGAYHAKSVKAVSGLSEGVPADGGFLVTEDLVSGLLQPMYDTGQLLQRARRFSISSNSNAIRINGIDETSRAAGSRWGGLLGYWLAEADEKTASKPKFRKIRLELHKLAALVYATDELLDDASALNSIIAAAVPQELRFMAEDSIVNGTGAGQPLGILNSGCIVSVAKETGQTAATVVAENIIQMWARLWAPSRSNAVWFINQDVEPQLYQLALPVGVGGQLVYMPPGGLSASPYGTLFGRPVVSVEYCPTLGTVGDIILADMSQYYLAEKGGIQAAQSIHVRFVYDESVFRFVYRIDGQPAWSSALTPFKGTNTVSPFVVLATRA